MTYDKIKSKKKQGFTLFFLEKSQRGGQIDFTSRFRINAKTNNVNFKIEIFRIINLATATAFTAVENKMPDHGKYITTPEFNKFNV